MKKKYLYLIVIICLFVLLMWSSLFSGQNQLAKISYSGYYDDYYNNAKLRIILKRYRHKKRIVHRKKGFILPVKGKIFHRKIYKGVFIKPEKYNIVKSANDGKVVFSGFLKYFGNVVIIQHANGYKSIYGYLKRNFVKKGDTVFQGDVIGKGYKNYSIYFELRKYNKCLASKKLRLLILNNG
jgi:murein DD-endopeptidase MepM/ murein hydrolase activator NlpD